MRERNRLGTRRVGISALLAAVWALSGCGGSGEGTGGSPATYTVGGTVTGLAGSGLVLQSSYGGQIAVSANGTFAFPSAMESGSPYTITIASQPRNPAQNCAISNAGGQVNDANVTNIALTCTTKGRIGYASSHSAIFCFSVDTDTGALTPLAVSPCDSGALTAVAVAPSGNFAYSTVSEANAIRAYVIDHSTWGLRAIAGSQLDGGGSPFSPANPVDVTVDPSGHFAYMANYGGSISAFAINVETGALSSVPGSPFLTAAAAISGRVPGANSVAVDPSGRFVYVANNQGNDISAYSIDSNTGALIPIPGSPFAAGTTPMTVRIEPSGKFAYVTNGQSNNVSGFSIDSVSGALSAIAGSPFSTGGAFPTGLAIVPSGMFLYVTNSGSNTIAAFAIDPNSGAISAVAGSPFASTPNPYSAAVHPSGQFLFVGSGDVSVYSIDASTGSLTSVAGSPFASIGDGSNTYSFAFTD
jgi:6-phosphogluconolactonase